MQAISSSFSNKKILRSSLHCTDSNNRLAISNQQDQGPKCHKVKGTLPSPNVLNKTNPILWGGLWSGRNGVGLLSRAFCGIACFDIYTKLHTTKAMSRKVANKPVGLGLLQRYVVATAVVGLYNTWACVAWPECLLGHLINVMLAADIVKNCIITALELVHKSIYILSWAS